ncbi:MAG: enoyl-CoA hydratase/isomerase family protein [Desulfobacula sp.]|nr:enoyl-CoA hydratase/isomerase family protein [Desulfobacula sp.]
MNKEAIHEFYETSIQNKLAIVKVKKRVFEFITDMEQSNKLIKFIDNLERNRDIKCLLFYNEPDSFNDSEYNKFMQRILENEKNKGEDTTPSFCEKNIRFREINVLNTIIRHLAELQILVISGIQGTVVTPFFGTSLVADFRFASAESVFSLAHIKYGLHPSGGLPFFLTNLLHHSKALEVQLKDKLSAEEAYNLGLVNKLISSENFEKELISEAEKFTGLPYCTIRDTKRLTNFSRKSLNNYFEFEASLLNL